MQTIGHEKYNQHQEDTGMVNKQSQGSYWEQEDVFQKLSCTDLYF